MEKSIYLNYAATSIQKPQPVIDAVCQYLQQNHEISYNRSFLDYESNHAAFHGREKIGAFFNVPDSSHVVFTSNITMALNMVLHGLLKTGDHVITTSVEHNAVMRPLYLLKEKLQIEVTCLPCQPDGTLHPDVLAQEIRPNTKVLVMTHASNVLGTILPIKECFAIAKEHRLITILDSAQTAGFLPIDMDDMKIDVLTFTGHKSLLALSGIGGFALRAEVAKQMEPWLTGGTGSYSQSLVQPDVLPDKFESGTLNSVGILGLTESINWLNAVGLEQISAKEREMTRQFLEGLRDLPVRVLGTGDANRSVPVVSIVTEQMSANDLSYELYENYHIVTRSGLHCAPKAHETAGTMGDGAVRFSFGWETTADEIAYTLDALNKILKM